MDRLDIKRTLNGLIKRVEVNGEVEFVDKDEINIVNIIDILKGLKGLELKLTISRFEKGVKK